MKVWYLVGLFFLMSASLTALEKSTLSADISSLTTYFFNDGKIRNKRYQALINQEVAINERFSTVLEARAWVDLAEMDTSWAPRHDYSLAVRNDEMLDAEFRQLYLDYLGDSLRIKVGLQLIDWVESLSPFTSDFLTAYDLRFGAFGDANQIIVPVVAFNLNHSFLGGNLEWLWVPLPVTDRLPAGPNGFGYYETIASQLEPAQALITAVPISRQLGEMELGVRFHRVWDALEFSLLGYRGHYRSPAFNFIPNLNNQISVVETFPAVVTFGTVLTYGTESTVYRLFTYFEPQAPSRFVLGNNFSPAFGQRFRVGGGVDYVFSKDLKIYSEFTATRADFSLAGLETEYIATIRATNESFEPFFFTLDASYTFPLHSFYLAPEASWKFRPSFKINLGARIFNSSDNYSPYDMLKNSSQLYLCLQHRFDLSD